MDLFRGLYLHQSILLLFWSQDKRIYNISCFPFDLEDASSYCLASEEDN